MKIVFPMIIMLIAGLALGGGSGTLLWSGQVQRGFRAQAEWKSLVDKQNVTIMEQSDALRRLTAATGRLIEATRTYEAACSVNPK